MKCTSYPYSGWVGCGLSRVRLLQYNVVNIKLMGTICETCLQSVYMINSVIRFIPYLKYFAFCRPITQTAIVIAVITATDHAYYASESITGESCLHATPARPSLH